MKIVIDENMPYALALFSQFGEVTALAGRAIEAQDLRDVDALMVRSITKVNKELLALAPKLRFIGSATAGVDHVDVELLRSRGIHFVNAPGCNKIGVAEYVLSALHTLGLQHDFALASRTVGIVGAGQVGSYLANCLDALNISYLLCDPFLEKAGDKRSFVSLDELIARADVVSLHTPLTYDGEHPTWHLFDAKRLAALKAGTILINAARGKVVDNQALKRALSQQKLTAVLDVFEDEPLVDNALLAQLAFATPHIAGYSLEGKARGTAMIFNEFCQFLQQEHKQVSLDALLDSALILKVKIQKSCQMTQRALCQLVYDIRNDDADFRRMMQDPSTQRQQFDILRKNYWQRREFGSLTVCCDNEKELHVWQQLGFKTEVNK
ncbi:MAG: 4-phosphoerythronate dehydrogenase PdxB [Vibrionaceae bacterium]